MMRLYLVVLGLVASTPGLKAQTIVSPRPKLDAERATLRDKLLEFRDTLNSIDAAAARLQRDFRQASPAALLSRARVMSNACARSARNVSPARQAVLTADASNQRRLKSQKQMVVALDTLYGVLNRCQAYFDEVSRPGQEENVRDYGNARAVQVRAALRRYERALAGFFSSMGIRVTPLGAEGRLPAG